MRTPDRARRGASLALALALLAFPACATLEGVFDPAGHPLAQGQAALEREDLDAAYAHLAEIRREHPESPESREAFPLAAQIFKFRYFRLRNADPDSPWVTDEPAFLFAWFDSFVDGSDFPLAEAEALFVGSSVSLFRAYQAGNGPNRPRFQVEDDNGIVTKVLPPPPEA